MSASINAPGNTITNRDGILLAYSTINAPGGSVFIGGEHFGAELAVFTCIRTLSLPPAGPRGPTTYPAGQTLGDATASQRGHGFTTINHCPPVTPLFKGRRRILERLSAYFCARDSGVRRRREFLLHGMGGSGKSQIALKFAEECEDR
jgi:hypothetical protein